MRLRDRVADRLSGGQLTELTAGLENATRAAEHARAANRSSQGRLAQVLNADVSRERYLRAVQLLGTVLEEFHPRPDTSVAKAVVGQGRLDHWRAVHDVLVRTDGIDDSTADREPTWPWYVHPPARKAGSDA